MAIAGQIGEFLAQWCICVSVDIYRTIDRYLLLVFTSVYLGTVDWCHVVGTRHFLRLC